MSRAKSAFSQALQAGHAAWRENGAVAGFNAFSETYNALRPFMPTSEERRKRYLHRASLYGCGCGYEGQYVTPDVCPVLAEQIRSGKYPGR